MLHQDGSRALYASRVSEVDAAAAVDDALARLGLARRNAPLLASWKAVDGRGPLGRGGWRAASALLLDAPRAPSAQALLAAIGTPLPAGMTQAEALSMVPCDDRGR